MAVKKVKFFTFLLGSLTFLVQTVIHPDLKLHYPEFRLRPVIAWSDRLLSLLWNKKHSILLPFFGIFVYTFSQTSQIELEKPFTGCCYWNFTSLFVSQTNLRQTSTLAQARKPLQYLIFYEEIKLTKKRVLIQSPSSWLARRNSFPKNNNSNNSNKYYRHFAYIAHAKV